LVLSNLGYSCGELSSDVKVKRKKVLAHLRSGKIKRVELTLKTWRL